MSDHDEVGNAPGALRYGVVDVAVLEDPEISTTAKAVYALLAGYTSAHDHSSVPSRGRLARSLKVNIKTVDRAREELRAHGVLTWTQRTDAAGDLTSCRYVLHHMGAPRVVVSEGGPISGGTPSSGARVAPPVGQRTHQLNTPLNRPLNTAPLTRVRATRPQPCSWFQALL